MTQRPPAAEDAVSVLNRVFVRALLALGAAGETEQACRLAAEAWTRLRHAHPREAERLNGALHALTRKSAVTRPAVTLPTDGEKDG